MNSCILFDSDVNGFSKMEFIKSVFNKRNVLFYIQTSNNDLFGFYLSKQINKIERYIYDEELFFIQLYINNKLKPKQLIPNPMNPLTGFLISSQTVSLFNCGMNDYESDINYLTINPKSYQSKIHLFEDFFVIQEADIKSEYTFLLERLIVIEKQN